QTELIPPFVHNRFGNRESLSSHHLANQFGGVLLAAHSSAIHCAQLDSQLDKMATQRTRLLVSKLRKNIVVISRARLRVTNQINNAQSIPQDSEMFLAGIR